MICLGLTGTQKKERVARYCAEHGIRKVFALGPQRFQLLLDAAEWIDWPNLIRYTYYYRLLQEIDGSTLVVVNECLRTPNRNDLTYNCIRNFLNQTEHQLVFQALPLRDTFEDVMILFDFDPRSRWKRSSWSEDLRAELRLETSQIAPTITPIAVPTDTSTRDAYVHEKRKLVADIGLRDPHTIPRNLYLRSGRARLDHIDPARGYVGRNNRFKIPGMLPYDAAAYPDELTVFEFCHDFGDFADFVSVSRQETIPALVADLKVDRWYLDRFQGWCGRLRDAYATLLE